MANRYLETHFTPEVRAVQTHYYGRAQPPPPSPERDPLATDETEFIERRDSFYMATITSNGQPFITPGYTEEEIRQAVAPLKKRIAELEARLAGNLHP